MRSPTLKKAIDRGLEYGLFSCVLLTVIVTVAVIALLTRETIEFFYDVPIIDFLFGTQWEPLLEPKSFGVLPLVFGTFMIVVGAMVVALPMGVVIAAYLSEYASDRFRSVIKPVLEVLAGIPTVVYGYFALTFVTPLLRYFIPSTEVFNAASGAIVVGIMILPLVSSLCDDAFRAVPTALRDGAYALGATSFEVTKDVVIPASMGRIGAAVILAVSRAIGETMAVTLASGATPKLTLNPFESIQTMTAYIVQVSQGDIPAHGVEYLSSYAVAALLFAITLVMNIVGNYVVFKGSKEFQ